MRYRFVADVSPPSFVWEIRSGAQQVHGLPPCICFLDTLKGLAIRGPHGSLAPMTADGKSFPTFQVRSLQETICRIMCGRSRR
jgi:hypothetical protein